MRPAERWFTCRAGHVHWGALGAAGLLFQVEKAHADATTYLLAQRSRWVDEGGTWGIPGGALRAPESPEQAARRETLEEIGVLPTYRVAGVDLQPCGGGWTFTVIHAVVDAPFEAFTIRETDATGWFTRAQMLRLPLHPGVAALVSGEAWRPGAVGPGAGRVRGGDS
jgi:8-oxo-dGTP pyrophosphatase MutT (NUDIX family)